MRRFLFRGPIIRATLILAVGTAAARHVSAEVLTSATWDTDSYVFFGTNSVASTEITLGEPTPLGVDPHYNIGFIEFDVAGLPLAGSKYLEVEPNTATAVLPSTVRLSALMQDASGYFAETTAAGRAGWLTANAFAQGPVATVDISSSGGKHYADVTSAINEWIANPSSNFGFALWRVGGDGFDSPELYSMNDPLGRGPVLNSVPEPGSIVSIIVAGLAFGATRARRIRRT